MLLVWLSAGKQDNLRGQSGVQIQCLGPPDAPLRLLLAAENLLPPISLTVLTLTPKKYM